jgi:cysteine-rich repeat protein
LFLSIGIPQAFAFSVLPQNDPVVLTNDILGTGITVVGLPTFTGAPDSAGLFSDGIAAGIGMDDGILIATGPVLLIDDLNDVDGTGLDNGTPGDPDLDVIVAPFPTFNASVLEFEFMTDSGNVSFDFVFASEEYNDFVNSEFNDVFALFVNGQNVALLPDGITPVAINTVNNGNPGGDPTISNPEFFNDNDIFLPTDSYALRNIEYDGFTTVFTAQATGLDPLATHTMKFAIADTSDGVLDSGVFIRAGSFSDAVCGNAQLEAGEQCDDGNTENFDGCSDTCQIETPVCGNAQLEAGEQCDDGNTENFDGCSDTCQIETPIGAEGCTPGYYKNNAIKKDAVSWTPTGLDPSDRFDSENAFEGDLITIMWADKGQPAEVVNPTLLQSLGANGGDVNAFARHVTAALLNALSEDVMYPATAEQVRMDVWDAVAGEKTFSEVHQKYAEYNELGCPINQQGERTE